MNTIPTQEERRRAADRLAASESFLAAARVLQENPAWGAFAKLLETKLRAHRAEHENPKRNALRRSEHLWAVKCLDELTGWLPQEILRAEKASRRADELLEP